MGIKHRAMMEAARRSLEERKSDTLGPLPPPCKNCGEPSKGTILVRGVGAMLLPVCSPLRCSFELAGDLSATTTYAPHPPGKYRGA